MTEERVPCLRRLVIERFRGFEQLDWLPSKGLNVLLGGGDVGKTTLLEAIGLLLRPTGSVQLSDSDYWLRNIESEFTIEGTFFLPETVGIHQLQKMIFPWEWNGTEACAPDPNSEEDREDPVYVLRVRGTADFEAYYEILNPDGTTNYFPVSLRRRIGLVWLTGDYVDRDLRLVYGSALDRLLSDSSIRARLAHEIKREDVAAVLSDDGKQSLESLNEVFRENALPNAVGLGLTSGRRISVASLVGLTAEKRDAQLPLATWGAGTQRLAALQVASANQSGTPVTLVDELERGLEPHRQRQLASTLRTSPSQSFVTTHSPIVLGASAPAAMWYLDSYQGIGQLSARATCHARSDPEAFLSKITIVAEGATEKGFLAELLERALGISLEVVGIYITDAGGNASALALLEDLSQAGLRVGGIVDNEGINTGRWARVNAALNDLFLQWESGSTEENVIRALDMNDLEALVVDPSDERTGERHRSLQERLQTNDKDWTTLVNEASDIRETVVETATGRVPDSVDDKGHRKRFKKHSQHWFKSETGGRELAVKMIQLDAWSALRLYVQPLLTAVGDAVELPAQDPANSNA